MHQHRLPMPKQSNCWVRLKSKLNHVILWSQTESACSKHVTLNTSLCQSQLAPARAASLTKGGAGIRPGNRRHNDKTKALALSTLDLHVVRLEGGRHHRTPTASPAAAPDAAGGSAARADGVERVLAPLGGPLALRQAGCLRAAVVGGGWRRGHVTFPFWHWGWRGREQTG